MGKFDLQKYERIKNETKLFFEENREIYSLALGKVYLNSEGFLHLIYKGDFNKHKRDWKNQIKRFELIKYLKPVLEGMKFYQEYQEENKLMPVKKRKQTFLENKIIKYWAFVAIINDKIRIKFIIKKVGNGNVTFWSVIPYWKTKNYKDLKKVILYKGNLEED